MTGMLSDQFSNVSNGLILAAVLVSVPAVLLSAVPFYWCEGEYVKTTEAPRMPVARSHTSRSCARESAAGA